MYMPVVENMLVIQDPVTTASAQITYHHHHGSYKKTNEQSQQQNKIMENKKKRHDVQHSLNSMPNRHRMQKQKTTPSYKNCQSLAKMLRDIQLTNQND